MDARTVSLLNLVATNGGTTSILEGEFQDDFEDHPFFLRAIDDKLIVCSPSSAGGVTYRVSLLVAGWAALGRTPPESAWVKAARHFAAAVRLQLGFRPSNP